MKHFELGNHEKDEIPRDFAPPGLLLNEIGQRDIPALAKDFRVSPELSQSQRLLRAAVDSPLWRLGEFGHPDCDFPPFFMV